MLSRNPSQRGQFEFPRIGPVKSAARRGLVEGSKVRLPSPSSTPESPVCTQSNEFSHQQPADSFCGREDKLPEGCFNQRALFVSTGELFDCIAHTTLWYLQRALCGTQGIPERMRDTDGGGRVKVVGLKEA